MILSANLRQNEGNGSWQGEAFLANPADFQRLKLGDDLTLQLGEESFNLVVMGKYLQRQVDHPPVWQVALCSPSARLSAPWSQAISQTWEREVGAREVVEALAGQEVDWQLVNWTIPAGRLAVKEDYPLEVIKGIVQQAGGVVEALPQGGLQVRHRFPVAVPRWQESEVDHVLGDEDDNLALQESLHPNTTVQQVIVAGAPPTLPELILQVDERKEGLNQGKKHFLKGETVHLLAYAAPGVSRINLDASVGFLHPGAQQTISLTEELHFIQSNGAVLSKPADAIESVVWLGENLGELTLAADKRTVQAANKGVAVARVSYGATAFSWTLTIPADSPPVEIYSIQINATAEGTHGDLVVRRGVGGWQHEIHAPLLSSVAAKYSRARAELDGGEWFDQILLTCRHRPGLLPGQLVEVRDGYLGESWRGKIIQVAHTAQESKRISRLTLLRCRARGAS